MQDYYAILRISRAASQEEIKRAYRQLIKLYHPDRFPNKEEAQRITIALNEAYEVLSDARRRAEYDHRQFASEEDQAEAAAYDWTTIKCDQCGAQDESLRMTALTWVLSLLIITQKNGWGKILCAHCRLKYSILFNLEVGFLGWWGIPWGPIFSIQAIANNVNGGTQPRTNNAALLSILAYGYWRIGLTQRALYCIQTALEFEDSRERRDFANYLRSLHPSEAVVKRFRGSARYSKLLSLLAALVPVIAIVCLFAFLPSGNGSTDYSKLYTPVGSSASRQGLPSEPSDIDCNGRYRDCAKRIAVLVSDCDRVVTEAAKYIKERSPLISVDTNYSRVTYNYALDRTALSESALNSFAISIGNSLQSVENTLRLSQIGFENIDSLAALDECASQIRTLLAPVQSAFFNLSFLALSITLYEESADTLLSDIHRAKLLRLMRHPHVNHWLPTYPRFQAFSDFCLQYVCYVDTIRGGLRIGGQLEKLNLSGQRLVSDLDALDTALARLDAAGDIVEYNRVVIVYNEKVKRLDVVQELRERLVNKLSYSASYVDSVDLETLMNACIDPAILRSQFDNVDLVSPGSNGNSSP